MEWYIARQHGGEIDSLYVTVDGLDVVIDARGVHLYREGRGDYCPVELRDPELRLLVVAIAEARDIWGRIHHQGEFCV